MVDSKVILAIVVSVLIISGVYFFVSVGNVTESGNSIKILGTGSSVTENQNTIEMTSKGFFPAIVTISAGEMVTFLNKDMEKHWPATDIHPTHTLYPGSDIKKCFDGTSDKTKLFDSCHGLEQGESYIFTFNEAGTWEYHDHLNANLKGIIIVK